MSKYLSYILLFIPLLLTSQQEVELIELRTDNEIILQGVNHFSDQSIEMILTINSVGFGLKKEEVFTKVLGPNSKLKLVTLTAKPNRDCSYSASMSYVATTKMAHKDCVAMDGEGLASKTTSRPSIEVNNPLNGKKGIVVYSKNGCGRCEYVVEYLRKNNIAFEDLNISINKKADQEMSEVLFASGFKGGSFMTPVITVDEEVHYNIENLQSFLEDLKK